MRPTLPQAGMTNDWTRREFVATSAALAAAAMVGSSAKAARVARAPDGLKVGVIGCGGRGTGAAADALEASKDVRIVALADVFRERLNSSRANLAGLDGGAGERAKVADDRCYVGFDAYKQLLASDVDLVILATPPHFRPIHLAEAISRGKHVFMEKPVAVDPAGVRSVLASGEAAAAKGLSIVAGTQRRHETSYLEAMKRIHEGAVGRILSARCYWNQGGLWMHARKPEWSDMEWQLKNWLYFAWLSGDHIVEQHVHNLDVVNWAMKSHPVSATGMGGRQVRTDPAYGHVFDHFAIEYAYPGNVSVLSMCRQIDGCDSRVEEVIVGSEGTMTTSPGAARLQASAQGGSAGPAWSFTGSNNNPYVQEHADLAQAIASGKPINEARNVAESTLTAIMGRMAAYTGKAITWEQALNSPLDLSPRTYGFDQSMPVPPVAVPGRTPVA